MKNCILVPIASLELIKNRSQWRKGNNENASVIEYNYDVVVPNDTTVKVTGNTLQLPAGEYTNTIIFEKYPSEIWKISVL